MAIIKDSYNRAFTPTRLQYIIGGVTLRGFKGGEADDLPGYQLRIWQRATAFLSVFSALETWFSTVLGEMDKCSAIWE